MTEDTPLTPEEHDNALAAELALGLLENQEAEAAVTRMIEDPGFARQVRDWQERLAGLAMQITPVMAPARAKQGIRERLGFGTAPLVEDPTETHPWWRGPFGALAGLVAAAAVAAFLWLPGQTPVTPTGPQPEYQAQLQSETGDLRVAARLDGREMEIDLQNGAAGEGRDLEIWWIRPDGSAPISIGLVPRSGNARMELPAELDPTEGIRIALSDEPAGGSPTGQATGPIVAIADLTRL